MTQRKPGISPFVVGMTGGIGSGKSRAAQLFMELGAMVIDADDISRALVAPGTPALAAIVTHFGHDLLDKQGGLKRGALRERIFHDPEAKTWLEHLLHPRIRDRIQARIATSEAAWLILCVPLLLESKHYSFVDRILVVDAPEELQVERTMARDKSSAKAVHRVMATQLTRKQRLKKADDIIDNSSDEAFLAQQVRSLFKTYEELAHARHQTG